MNILLIVKSLDGGTGTFVSDFLRIEKFFKKQKLKIKIIVLERPNYKTLNKEKYFYIRPRKFYPKQYSLSPINFLNFFEELNVVRKQIKHFNPQIVMGIEMRCNMLAIFSKIYFGNKIRTIATTHLNLKYTTIDITSRVVRPVLRLVIKLIYEKADALVCVSRGLSGSLKKDFGITKSIKTIYYGRDLKIRNPKIFSKKKEVTILTVCRLNPQKDVESLIKSIQELEDNKINTKLLIAGDGVSKFKLKTLVKRFSLQSKIKFLGWVKNANHLYNKSDIFVLSSKSEGFGYVLVEAMAHGLPVISTNTPYGPKEVLENGKYGILVPMRDPKALKNAVLKLISNKKLYSRFSKASIQRSAFFTIDKMFKSYNLLFTKIIT